MSLDECIATTPTDKRANDEARFEEYKNAIKPPYITEE
jgi:hypothetical protein